MSMGKYELNIFNVLIAIYSEIEVYASSIFIKSTITFEVKRANTAAKIILIKWYPIIRFGVMLLNKLVAAILSPKIYLIKVNSG